MPAEIERATWRRREGAGRMAHWVGLYYQYYPTETYFQQFQRNALERMLRQALRMEGSRDIKELLLTLLGAAPGQAALAQHSQVSNAAPFDLYSHGGDRDIVTIDDVNRVTTAADVTELAGIINSGPAITRQRSAGGTYPNGDPRFTG